MTVEFIHADRFDWQFRDSLNPHQCGIAESLITWAGMVFRVFKSSNGRLNCSMTTGPQDFIGYFDSIEDAAQHVVSRYSNTLQLRK